LEISEDYSYIPCSALLDTDRGAMLHKNIFDVFFFFSFFQNKKAEKSGLKMAV
jgi:hypothetical protein